MMAGDGFSLRSNLMADEPISFGERSSAKGRGWLLRPPVQPIARM
jgi:hypothetical protein